MYTHVSVHKGSSPEGRWKKRIRCRHAPEQCSNNFVYVCIHTYSYTQDRVLTDVQKQRVVVQDIRLTREATASKARPFSGGDSSRGTATATMSAATATATATATTMATSTAPSTIVMPGEAAWMDVEHFLETAEVLGLWCIYMYVVYICNFMYVHFYTHCMYMEPGRVQEYGGLLSKGD